MKVRLVALAVVIAALLTTALTVAWDHSDLRPGEAWLRLHGDARAEVADEGGSFVPVAHDRRLRPNDRVRVVEGAATLEMVRGLEIELRHGSDVTVDRAPTLNAGQALVRTEEVPTRMMASASSAAVVAPRSVARLSRSLSYSAAVYRGGVALHSVGRSIDVPALRQASVSAVGAVSIEPLPIFVDESDEWDRRYLGAAIELTRQLDAVSQGFSANVITSIRPLTDVVLDSIPGATRTREFDVAASGSRRPGELLVGAAIATAAKAPVTPVFAFRDQGATWGLVALDQAIDDADRLFGLLRLALGEAPILATRLAAPSTTSSAQELARGGEAASRPDSNPNPSADDPAEPAPTTTSLDEAVAETTDDVVEAGDEVLDLVTDTSDELLGAADDSTTEATDSLTQDTTDTVAGELEGATEPLLNP